VSVEGQLDIIAKDRGIDRGEESSFDSGDIPKAIFADRVITPEDASGDMPADVCGHCLEPLGD